MTKKTKLIVLIVMSCYLILGCGSAKQSRSNIPSLSFGAGSSRVKIIAHRGNRSREPENTLPAFRSAINVGADLVELDYHHSADGEPIVIHDGSLERTTDIEDHALAQSYDVSQNVAKFMTSLDAGSWFSKEKHDVKLPLLSEALDLIQSSRATTLIERKAGDAKTCFKLLKKKDLLDKVVVQAFNWEYLKDLRTYSPNLTLAALGNSKLDAAILDELTAHNIRIISWSYRSLNEESIALAHSYGMEVWAYTVNDLNSAQQLVDAGVDGIITDIPAEVRANIHRNSFGANAWALR